MVTCGLDFRFGFKREGDIQDLKKHFKLNLVDYKEVNRVKISSSVIKELLSEGNIELANRFLGKEYTIVGEVVPGNKIRRNLGFPTANIKNDNIKKILKPGVYGVLIYVDNVKYLGMMNIGHNPTCNFVDELSTEVNIFDLNEKLYEKEVTICCLCFVRDEKKFNSVDELINQLKNDKEFIINKNHILAIK
jgi:riboflavin kinase/FMN adenylyltransferase